MEFFSIIVPAYNVEAYIENTVNSIIEQNFFDYRLFLVDDGSTDKTADICCRLTKNHPDRIEFLKCKHRGVSAARNEGLKAAKGQYVMFVDGDDFLVEGALRHLYDFLNTESPDLLCFDFARVSSMYEKAPVNRHGEFITEKMASNKAIAWKLGEKTIPCVASCIKNSLIQDNRITFDEDISYVEDALFLFRCMLVSGSIWNDRNTCYCYLQRPGSATHLGHVPASVSKMELKAWKRVRKLLSFDPELITLVDARVKPIKREFYRKKIKELLGMG